MSILDIATHIEVASQPPASLADQPSSSRVDNSSNGYQKALSSSLNQVENRPHGAPGQSAASHGTHDARIVEPVPTASGSESGSSIASSVPENSPPKIGGMLFEGVNSTSFVIPESEAVVPAQRVTTSESIPRAGETDGSENLGQIQPAVFSQIVSEPPTNFQFSLQIYRPPEDTIAEESVSLETGDQPLPPSSFFRIDGRPAGLTVEEPHAGTLPPVGLVTVDGPPSGSVANPELSPVEELPASDVRAVQPKLFSDSGPVEPEITTPQRPEFSTTVESTNAGPEGGSRTYLESIGLEPAAGTSTRETPTQSPVTHASRAVAQTNHGSVLAPNASAHGGPAAPPQSAVDGHVTAVENSASVREVAIANVHVDGQSAVRPADGDVATRAAEFVDRLSETIRLSRQQNRPLRLRLHPPELGTLQVEVVSRNGNLTVRFQVENAAAHKAILDSLSLLQNSLGQNGAVVERIEVQQVANLSDSRQSELGREGERDSDDSPADRRQQDDEQRHKRDKPPSDDQHRQQDPEEIDIEI